MIWVSLEKYEELQSLCELYSDEQTDPRELRESRAEVADNLKFLLGHIRTLDC